MRDIETRQDIEQLVDIFYKQVISDEVIGKFFTQVVKLDWNSHIPRMYDFWETLILGNMQYKGNPMIKHLTLNKKQRLETVHFERWLKLWASTIHSLFHGPKANEAINRAEQIAGLMKHKVDHDSSIS